MDTLVKSKSSVRRGYSAICTPRKKSCCRCYQISRLSSPVLCFPVNVGRATIFQNPEEGQVLRGPFPYLLEDSESELLRPNPEGNRPSLDAAIKCQVYHPPDRRQHKQGYQSQPHLGGELLPPF